MSKEAVAAAKPAQPQVEPQAEASLLESLAAERLALRSIQAAVAAGDGPVAEAAPDQTFSLPAGSFKVSSKPPVAGRTRTSKGQFTVR